MRRSVSLLACLVATLAVAGCSRDTNPVRDAFVSMGAGAKVPAAPDFVVASRTTEQGDYVPVGLRQPPRKYKAKTADEIKAVEGQLDAVRTRTEAQGAAVAREGAGHASQ